MPNNRALIGSTLRGRMLRVLLLFAVLPLGVMAVYVSLSMRAATTDAARENLEDRAQLAAASVELKRAEFAAAVEALATNPIVISESATIEEQTEQLLIAQHTYPDLEDITLVDTNGVAITSTDFRFRGNWEGNAAYQQALTGAPGMSPPRWITSPPGRLVIQFTAPVIGSDGVTGVIAGQIALNRIWATLEAASIGEAGFVALLDANGNYLAHPDRDLVLARSSFGRSATGAANALDGGDADSLFWDEATVGATGWTAVAAQPKAEVHAAVNELLRNIALVAVATTLVAGVAAFWLSGKLTGLTERLSQSLARVTAGELQERAELSGLREFDGIAYQFNVMSESLHQSTTELRQSEERFRSLVAGASDVVTLVDAGGHLTYASPAADRVLGHRPETLTWTRMGDLVHEDDVDEVERKLRHVMATPGSSATAEYRLKQLDGSWRVIETVFTNMLDNPSVDGVVMNSRDISDRRQLEADVAAAKEFDRLKTEFVGLASHELRTPMTGIYGFASLLAASDELPEQELGWATRIEAESGRLTEIINDLLNVSRIESGELEFEHTAVDLGSLAEEVARPFLEQSEQHQITVEHDGAAVIAGDRGKLSEVISNLLDNAVKYSPGGGAVSVRVAATDEAVELIITDEGIGIPKAEIERLFTRFHRIARPGLETIRSTGLGLYLVKKLVEGMGGTVVVESRDGAGSTFGIRFPPLGEASERAA